MFFRLIGVLTLGSFVGVVPGATPSATTSSSLPQAANPPLILPASFGSWKRGVVQQATPEVQDDAAWREFGFQTGSQASYVRAGAKVTVSAFQFPDATGAYGAFTLLHAPGMQPEQIAAERYATARLSKPGKDGRRPRLFIPATQYNGARSGDVWLLWKGNLLVEAAFASGLPGEKAAMMQLDMALSSAAGSAGVPPGLPEQLPQEGLDVASLRYAIGPAAYQLEGGVLPPELIHFDQDAEAVTAQYGKGTLTLLAYPTPQIADARMAAIAGALQQGAVKGTPGALLVKRAGTRVAVTSGGFTPAQAKALLAQVQFREHIAMDRLKPKVSEIAKTAQMLTSVALLTVILGGASILLGLFLGGGRAIYRVMRGKPASSLHDEEFIALNINDK
ncbi:MULTISPECIES: DUF6599 family protein [Acidobacterium]|nr:MULTISPECIES: DUF6599 family protein [Acidobacterium]HCT59792.1 hypothetical protein [Acidobacterium sp.]